MTPADIEAILREAFGTCEAIGYPLEAVQKQVLLRSLLEALKSSAQASSNTAVESVERSNLPNPLDELTVEQRQILLRFIQGQTRENSSWKVQLLNDWLNNRDSGEMQVFRQQYGLQWLEQIQSIHIAQYADEVGMNLKVGDRIQVCNRLWEWVQNDDPDNQEWLLCTVIHLTASHPSEIQSTETQSKAGEREELGGDRSPMSGTVRFDNGMEYEIQGIYEWNRYNWRWVKDQEVP